MIFKKAIEEDKWDQFRDHGIVFKIDIDVEYIPSIEKYLGSNFMQRAINRGTSKGTSAEMAAKMIAVGDKNKNIVKNIALNIFIENVFPKNEGSEDQRANSKITIKENLKLQGYKALIKRSYEQFNIAEILTTVLRKGCEKLDVIGADKEVMTTDLSRKVTEGIKRIANFKPVKDFAAWKGTKEFGYNKNWEANNTYDFKIILEGNGTIYSIRESESGREKAFAPLNTKEVEDIFQKNKMLNVAKEYRKLKNSKQS